MLTETLTTLGALGLETGLNTALKLDPALAEKISAREGKIICLACTDPEINVAIVLGSKCMVLRSIHWTDDRVSASLIGDSAAWGEMLRSEDKAAALINSSLQLRGDSGLFQELAQLADTVDLDWESALSGMIGDVPTHLVSQLLSFGASRITEAREMVEGSIDNYFESDTSLVVSKTTSDRFYSELRNLEISIERLEARMRKL